MFLNGPTPAYFCLLLFFQQKLDRKIIDFSGIQTRITRVEGAHADQFDDHHAQMIKFG